MKSLLAISLMLLGTTTPALAQDSTSNAVASLSSASTAAQAATIPTPSPTTPVLDISESNGGEGVTPVRPQDSPLIALAARPRSLAALSFATPAPAASFNASGNSLPALPAGSADPSPATPRPPYGYNEREYNLEIALGVSVVRFRSSVYEATGVGFHSAAAFFLKDWLAVEAALTSGFAPTIFADEHVKILTYGGGPKISLGHRRIEPWLHVLAGGIHALPQTAAGGQNGFQATSGLGADYGLSPRLSIRLEGDYVRSRLFSQWQNNYQGIAAVVIHF
jgi:hypothetical protein